MPERSPHLRCPAEGGGWAPAQPQPRSPGFAPEVGVRALGPCVTRGAGHAAGGHEQRGDAGDAVPVSHPRAAWGGDALLW